MVWRRSGPSNFLMQWTMVSNSQMNGPTSYHFSVAFFNSLPATHRDSYDATPVFELDCLIEPKAAEDSRTPKPGGSSTFLSFVFHSKFDVRCSMFDVSFEF